MNNTAGDRTGMAWPKDEIDRIAAADDLHVSPLREDRGDVWRADMDLVGHGR